MSYRIEYHKPEKNHPFRLPVLTAACFFLFLLLVRSRWPEGSEILCSALEQFARDLAVGEGTGEAVSAFFQTLVP